LLSIVRTSSVMFMDWLKTKLKRLFINNFRMTSKNLIGKQKNNFIFFQFSV
jgi:hypothetical protein